VLHDREHGTGPPLVLLHPGPGLDGSVFFPWFAEGLPGRRLVAVDLAASGRSPGDPAEWTIERHAESLAGWLEDHGLAGATVLGHSYGGFVALTLAVRRPDVIGAVVASCSAGSEQVFDGLEERIAAAGDAVLAAFAAEGAVRTPEDCRRAWLGQLPFFVAGDPARVAPMLDDVVFRPETSRTEVDEEYDVLAELGECPLPVLAIGGAADRCTPIGASRAVADAAPHGALESIEGAGHFAYAERPAAYFPALDAWLSATGSASR
jgi:3-oxoadipate enol-lactonase